MTAKQAAEQLEKLQGLLGSYSGKVLDNPCTMMKMTYIEATSSFEALNHAIEALSHVVEMSE
jgi:hypothetical protein